MAGAAAAAILLSMASNFTSKISAKVRITTQAAVQALPQHKNKRHRILNAYHMVEFCSRIAPVEGAGCEPACSARCRGGTRICGTYLTERQLIKLVLKSCDCNFELLGLTDFTQENALQSATHPAIVELHSQ